MLGRGTKAFWRETYFLLMRPVAAGELGEARACRPDARTPLASGVRERGLRQHEVPFHMPGHSRGRSVHHTLQELSKGALSFDTTELEGLDYLAYPSGIIAEAQELASEAFGADRSWFLVNGTTVGIHAAVMSAVREPGDAVVISRDCHQSAFSAMILADAVPVWAEPEYDDDFGFASASATNLCEALAGCSRAPAAVLAVSPNYYGVCAGVRELASCCHSRGVPLLVDEAHGSHFAFHRGFPPTSLSQGADLVVQSTHKTLSAMTQASMLHVSGPRVCSDRVTRSLQILQSSSPSYVLMSSLDAARAHASEASDYHHDVEGDRPAGAGEQTFSRTIYASLEAKDEISRVPGLRVLRGEGVDPLRLTVGVSGLGQTGFEVSRQLEEEYGVVPELATQASVVFIVTLGTASADLKLLVRALREVAGQSDGPGRGPPWSQPSGLVLPSCGTQAMSPRQAFFAGHARVETSTAVGRVAAEIVCPYPPGIPILYPGEKISEEALEFLLAFKREGGYVSGCSDATLDTLLVVE